MDFDDVFGTSDPSPRSSPAGGDAAEPTKRDPLDDEVSSSSSSSGDSSASSSSSGSDSSGPIVKLVTSKKKVKTAAEKLQDTSAAARSEPNSGVIGRRIPNTDVLDADIDDESLMEFFSEKEDETKANDVQCEQQQIDHGEFDSLDDEALAELDEEILSPAPMGSKPAAPKEYTISYNGEKKATPIADEDIDPSSDSEGEDDGMISFKENRQSNNKSKFFDNLNGDDSTVETKISESGEMSEMPRRGSSPAEAPGSPSSLDTPRPNPPSPSSSMQDAASQKKIEVVPRPRIPNNPYRKVMKAADKGQHAVRRDSKVSPATSNGPERQSASLPDVPPSYHSGVETLPDIPTANMNELQRLGIEHNMYKPPRFAPGPDPIVHRFDRGNHPPHARRSVPVDQVFSHPVKNMWKSKFRRFNHVQSEMANVLANSEDNVVISAPTGAGKTALFEMAMGRLLSSTGFSNTKKIVYLAPNKALCEERQADWSMRLRDIDSRIVVTTITGDSSKSSSMYADIASSHLILTTPEKLDSITRKWGEVFVLLASIKLVLIDEVHLIGEKERGSTLESLVSRLKSIQRAATARQLTADDLAGSSYKSANAEVVRSNMRTVAVSATLPNLGQLASFLDASEAFVFDQSYRPVPLKIYVQACGFVGSNRFLFDKSLNQHVPSILRKFSSGRPSLVFCHSKKECEILAEELTRSYAGNSSSTPSLLTFSNRTGTPALHRCLRKGIAYHHAGLDAADRRLVEEAFTSGSISCLCATSTLAMGVNLPSHLVIVKGTSCYRGAGIGNVDIDSGTLLQMIGRAGRPGFDSSGTAVIMTDTNSKTRYENLSQGLKVVESYLFEKNRLAETLAIEISQKVITSVGEAADWIKSSFIYKRLQSNPLLYGYQGRSGGDLDSFVSDKCADAINLLRKIRAITIDEDGCFAPDAGCHILSRSFVDYDTMKSIVKLPHDAGAVQILHMLANSPKIQTDLRRNEKKPLNEAYKLIKYRFEGPQSKVRIKTSAEKAFVLLQSSVGRYHFTDFSLRSQMQDMVDGAFGVLTAVEELAKEGSKNGQVALEGILLRRSLYSGLWGEKDGVLSQINGVTHEMSESLREHNICTFADVMRASTEDIARACHVTTSFANSLRTATSKILTKTLTLSAWTKENSENSLDLMVKLDRKVAGSEADEDGGVVSYTLLVYTDREGGLLHYSEEITNSFELVIKAPLKFGRAYIRLVSNLAGLDEQVTIDGNDKIQKSKAFTFSPTTAKSTTKNKGKRQGKIEFAEKAPLTSKKRHIETSHRDSVSNVNDMRIRSKKKRTTHAKNKADDGSVVIIDDEAVEFEPHAPSENRGVTPSPHPKSAKTPPPTTRDATSGNSRPYSSRTSVKSQSAGTSRKRRDSRSWFHDKHNQKTSQETAFRSPKDNPFQGYTYDPNDIEGALGRTNSSEASRGRNEQKQSILPRSVPVARPRTTAFKTPGTRRKVVTTGRMSQVELLKQKAEEMNRQHHPNPRARVSHRNEPTYRDMGPSSVAHGVNGFENNFEEERHRMTPSQLLGDTIFQVGASQSVHSAGTRQYPFEAGPGPRHHTTGMDDRPAQHNQTYRMNQHSHHMKSLTPPFIGRGQIGSNYSRCEEAGFRPASSAGRSLSSRLRANGGQLRTRTSHPSQQQDHPSQMYQRDASGDYNVLEQPQLEYPPRQQLMCQNQPSHDYVQQQQNLPGDDFDYQQNVDIFPNNHAFRQNSYNAGANDFQNTFQDPLTMAYEYEEAQDPRQSLYQQPHHHPDSQLTHGPYGHLPNPPNNPYAYQKISFQATRFANDPSQGTQTRNPYNRHPPAANPYKKQEPFRPQPPHQSEPPVREISVQNNSLAASVANTHTSGLGPEDDNESRVAFEDAFEL